MDVKAKAKHIRVSPKKVRLVADIIRGMEINKALSQLSFVNKKAVKPVKKLVESAIANAQHNYELDKNNLFIKEISVNEGRILYRWTPRALGRATPIRKRTSHINLILGELVDSGVVEPKKQEVDPPVNLEDMAKGQSESSKKEAEQSSGKKQADAKKKKASSASQASASKTSSKKSEDNKETKETEKDAKKAQKKSK